MRNMGVAGALGVWALWTAMSAAAATTITVGARETVYTVAQRNTLGLNYWPDGNMGFVPQGGGLYRVYAANSTSGVRTGGTLDAPGGGKQNVTVTNWKGSYNYLAGGPTYLDPGSGHLLLFYHAEVHRGSAVNFYSALGLAVSTDANHLAFRDLGLIVTAHTPEDQAAGAVEMCGAPFMIRDGYFHLYFRDQLTNGASVNLGVARASVSNVVAQALLTNAAPWFKYYDGSFSQPAIGGLSSPLESGNPNTRWMDVAYCSYLGKYVMAVAQGWPGPDLYLLFSDDGIAWSPRTALETEAGESFYPSLVGTGTNPETLDASFYIYYTHSAAGDFDRWSDAVLARRLITLDDGSTATTTTSTSSTSTSTTLFGTTSTTSTTAPAPDPLVCRLDFEDGAGSTATDRSGRANDGALAGQAAWDSGVSGGGLRLDPAGGDDYATIPDNATTENIQEGNYTVMAWFKPLSVPAGSGSANNAAYGIVMKNGYHLGLKYQNNRAFVFDHWTSAHAWAGAGTSGSAATGEFWHVAGVLDRSNGMARIYVNGELRGSNTFAAGAAAHEYGTTTWKVGVADPGAGSYSWPAHGMVDDVRLYGTALSGAEIAAIADDADEDALPDRWERIHFGGLDQTDGVDGADWDTDGFPDRHEFLAGTDPTNAASRLAFDTVAPADDRGAIELRWQSQTGRLYRVLERGNLTDNTVGWTTNRATISAAPPLNVVTVHTADAAQFWRVELEP